MEKQQKLKDLKDTAEKVAEVLSGHPCVLELRPPHMTRTAGIAFKRHDVGYIYVDPELSPTNQYKVFLHEVAHLKFDWDDPTMDADSGPIDIAALPARSVELTPEEAHALASMPREDRAEKQVSEWVHYAEFYRPWKYGELGDRLIALAKYPQGKERI